MLSISLSLLITKTKKQWVIKMYKLAEFRKKLDSKAKEVRSHNIREVAIAIIMRKPLSVYPYLKKIVNNPDDKRELRIQIMRQSFKRRCF